MSIRNADPFICNNEIRHRYADLRYSKILIAWLVKWSILYIREKEDKDIYLQGRFHSVPGNLVGDIAYQPYFPDVLSQALKYLSTTERNLHIFWSDLLKPIHYLRP